MVTRAKRYATVLLPVLLSACGGGKNEAQAPGGGSGTSGGGSGGSGGSGGASAGSAGASGASAGAGGAPVGMGVVISPKSVVVPSEAQQTFTCTVSGHDNRTCTFQVTEPSGGTINAQGIYTAPASAGTYHVVATSVADTTKSDSATVTVRPPAVANCDSLPAPGTFENITPGEVLAGFGGSGTDWGTFAIAVDPNNSGIVYLGTVKQKVWKSTDCGSSWSAVATGRNGAQVNSGMNWTFLVDPNNSNVLYTNSGYGDGTNGAYKSTNGGVDWDPVWPPPNQPELKDVVQYGFANVFAMDPTDSQHLLLTFHAPCAAPYNQTCLAESMNGGATWRIVNGHSSWSGTEGLVIYFLDNSRTWLFASQSNGFWRTEDSGATWARTNESNNEAHPQGSQIVRARDGTFYLAAGAGVSRSPDGRNWTLIPDSGPLAGGLVSDGTTMFLSTSFYPAFGANIQPYRTAPESSGAPWSAIPSPGMTSGGTMAFDRSHRLLYSSNFQSGMFRVVVP